MEADVDGVAMILRLHLSHQPLHLFLLLLPVQGERETVMQQFEPKTGNVT